MKLNLLTLFIFSVKFIWAQTFTEMPPSSPFIGVSFSAFDFSDIDGDQDMDIFIIGRKGTAINAVSRLYINDGSGVFSEAINTTFEPVSGGAVAFSDVDRDNDQDILLTGRNSGGNPITKLYLNDGNANFTEVVDTPFEWVEKSAIAFSDVDGDNDQDILLIGRNADRERITKLYLNDGRGNFTELVSTPFVGVADGAIAFSDVDGDNDQDVLLTGRDSEGNPITKLYLNDGNANFIEVEDTSFKEVEEGAIAFSDVDGDNDQDVLLIGQDSEGNPVTKLYLNDGNANFTEVEDTSFKEVEYGAISFSDVDGDNDQDVLITGQNSENRLINNLYINNGRGHFSEIVNTPFDEVYYGAIGFMDIDMDNDQDLFISGINQADDNISKLYTNDGNGNFVIRNGIPFEFVYSNAIAFSDVDGDNDQDVLLTGRNSSENQISKLYLNDGAGNFLEVMDTPFEKIEFGTVTFLDVDGDNDQDALLTGKNRFVDRLAKLYLNDGKGAFVEVANTPFEGVFLGNTAFSDIDGDNDQDLLITGQNSDREPTTKLYLNDGRGNFTKMVNTPFVDVDYGSITFLDMDMDNDQDVLITGLNSERNPIIKLYANNGEGNFTEVVNTPFENIGNGNIAVADVDGDNDQDILINRIGLGRTPKLYINDGVGNFTETLDSPFGESPYTFVAFVDVDNDNDQDVIVTKGSNLDKLSKLYINDGEGNFMESPETLFEDISISFLTFSDVDGDNNQDILITGRNCFREPVTKLYLNGEIMTTITTLKSKMLNNKFTIYPNPFTNNINFKIDTPQDRDQLRIQLFDNTGRLLTSKRIINTNGQVSTSQLPSGFYVYQLLNPKGVIAKGKLVKP